MLTEKKFNLIIVLGIFAFSLIGYVVNEPYFITLATKIVILGIAGCALNLILGFGGMVSFGHAMFFGVGSYVAAISAFHSMNGGSINLIFFDFNGSNQMLFNWFLAVIFSMFFALVVGSISIRTSGVYFIMITLAFAQMTYYFSVGWTKYGGEDGLSTYVRNDLFSINTMLPLNFFIICFSCLCVVGFVLNSVINSNFGNFLKGCKENEEKMISLGLNPYTLKLTAFVISGAITGLAGALYVDLNRFVSPTSLSWQTSGELIVLVILGGSARLFGPLLGAIVFILLEQFLGEVTENWQFWLGVILVLIVLYFPKGVSGFFIKD